MSDSSTIGSKFIPDDIILSILNKLDVRDVARYRCVCRRFKSLTSNEDFVNSLVSTSAPMIFAGIMIWGHEEEIAKETHYLYDKWWDQFSNAVPKVCSFSKHSVKSTHNGFIILKQRREFTILNPTNKEKVTVFLPEEPLNIDTDILGIFLHPVLKEYCTIWYTTRRRIRLVDYKILDLGNKSCWRGIGEISYEAGVLSVCPVLVGDFLYWMVQSYELVNKLQLALMALDVRTEEISMVSLPHDCLTLCLGLCDRTLHSIDGFLSIIYMKPDGEKIRVKIWTLKDRERKWWTSSNYVLNFFEHLEHSCFQAISFVNKELVFQLIGWDEKRKGPRNGNFVGSLENGTVRHLFGSRKRGTMGHLRMFSHTPSLANLKKCKHVIRLDQESTEQEEPALSHDQ